MSMIHMNIMHTWMFGNMPLSEICRKVKNAGFDGIDISISNDESYSIINYKKSGIREIARDFGLEIPVASALMKGPSHDLSHNDNGLRQSAIDFVKRSVDAAVWAGAKYLLVMPSRIFNTVCYTSREEDWARSVGALSECADYADSAGIALMLEPLNRQKVTLVRTLKEGCEMIRETGKNNIYLVPDVYQMAMEEPNGIINSIYKYGKWIRNLHVADSTRHVPGMGNYNWNEILTALCEVGYSGPLSFEPVYTDFDCKKVIIDAVYESDFLQELSMGTEFIRIQMNLAKFAREKGYSV